MSITVERLTAEIDADPSRALAGLAAMETALDAASRDRTAHVEVDVDRNPLDFLNNALSGIARQAGNAASNLPSLTDALQETAGAAGDLAGAGSGGGGGGLKGLAGGFAEAAGGAVGLISVLGKSIFMFGGIVAIVSVLPGLLAMAAAGAAALVAALAPLVGLLGVIPVGLGVLGLGLGAVITGFSGVGEGLKAMTGLDKDASAATQELTDRTRALAMAQRSLRDAQHAAAESLEDLKKAQEAYSEAPHDAREALEDQRRATKQAVLDEESAVLRLKRAQENLAAAQNKTAKSGMILSKETDYFTGKVYEVARQSADAVSNAEDERAAKLEVRQAELSLQTARDRTKDQQRDLAEMEKKGIKNSDIMVDARERLTDAQWGYKKSLEGVKDAEYNLAQARKDLTKATTQGTAAMQAYQAAMDKLSPAGKSFVKFLHDEFLPAWDDVKKKVQEELLPGIERGLRSMKGMFDDIGTGLADIAGKIGNAFGDFMEFWAKPKRSNQLKEMFSGLGDIMGTTLKMMKPMSRIIVAIIQAATPMVDLMAKDLLGKMREFATYLESDKGKKKTQDFFMNSYKWLKRWGSVLKPIMGALGGIIKAATPLAKWMFKEMSGYFTDLEDRVTSAKGQGALKEYFNDQKPALLEFAELMRNLGDLLFNSTKGGEDSAFVQVLRDLNDDGIPAIQELVRTLDDSSFASGFVKTLTTILKTLNGIIDAIDYINDGGADAKTGDQSWWEVMLFGKESDEQKMHQSFKDTSSFIGQWFHEFPDQWDKYVNQEFGGLLRDLGTKIGNWWDTFWADFKTSWKRNWADFKDLASKAWEWIQGLPDKIRNIDWSGVWDGLWDSLSGVLDSIKEGFSNFGKVKVFGGKEIDVFGFLRGDEGKQFGGAVEKDKSYIVGEKRPEIFTPSTSGRIMPRATPSTISSNGAGITDAQMERVLRKVMDNAKAPVNIDQTFNEKVDPMQVSRELAWSLA